MLTNSILEEILSIKYEDFSNEVVENTKVAITHALNCIANSKLSSINSEVIENTDLLSNGVYPVFFYKVRLNFLDAVFANSYLAQSTLLEDVHVNSNSHPGIIVVPAAILTALKENSSGKELIEAVIKGYEIMGRLGYLLNHKVINERGFRPTSILGAFGSAVASAHLMKLTKSEVRNAISLAANMASGLNTWPTEGTDEIFVQNGHASRNGVKAALLAKNGLKSASNILEHSKGFFSAFSDGVEDEDPYLQNKSCFNFSINEIKYKYYPACALIQSAGELGKDLRECKIDNHSINQITIYTHRSGLTYPGCNNQGPFQSELSAKMSNQFLFASCFLYGYARYELYNDSTILDLCKKIDVVEYPSFTDSFPKVQKMKAKVELQNQETILLEVKDAKYYKKEEIKENSHKNWTRILGELNGKELFDLVMGIESMNTAKGFDKILEK